MKHLLTLIVVLLLTSCVNQPNTKSFRHQSTPSKSSALLKLDTKGHTSLIRDIIVTKSGDIISASDDKTIRVWNSTTGKEKRKILGEIGGGVQGQIFAIALSPNEEYLAVGGYLGSYTGKKKRVDEEAHWIRLYHYPTGRLLKVLKSHTDIVNDLAFSQDGRYLISGSGDYTAIVWGVKSDFKAIKRLKFHKDDVYAVRFIENEGRTFAVTAGLDNQIALFDIERSTQKPIAHHRLDHKLHSLAINTQQFSFWKKSIF